MVVVILVTAPTRPDAPFAQAADSDVVVVMVMVVVIVAVIATEIATVVIVVSITVDMLDADTTVSKVDGGDLDDAVVQREAGIVSLGRRGFMEFALYARRLDGWTCRRSVGRCGRVGVVALPSVSASKNAILDLQA
ncbi:MAG: hypothetical protein AAF899_15760 [Pseudomonadota bacterium]